MRKLGRKKSNREHLIRNQAGSLVLYETIDTTLAKAKTTKSFLERLISRCKAGDLSAIRRADASFFDKNASKKLILELLPRYKNRKSGYIKSYHLKNRLGDNSEMMRLELVDKKVFLKEASVETKISTKSAKKTDPSRLGVPSALARKGETGAETDPKIEKSEDKKVITKKKDDNK